MNLAADYFSLFGTKVVIGSLFTVCAARNFWPFSVYSLYFHFSYFDEWFCAFTVHNTDPPMLLHNAIYWIEVVSFVIVLLLLVLAVWKRKRSPNFVFSHMNGATEDNDDAEVVRRVVVFSSASAFALKAPSALIFIAQRLDFIARQNSRISKVLFALRLIYAAYPLSTPIVCFAVKSRFRDELKVIVDICCNRCCPGSWCHITLPLEAGINRSSILQMDPIQADASVTKGEEDSEPIRDQT